MLNVKRNVDRLTSGIWGIGLLVLVLVLLLVFFDPANMVESFRTETQMILAIIIGAATLLAALSFVTVIFSHLGLNDRQQALGLPQGSIRAIIAISLIILFTIMAVYLFDSVGPSFKEITNATNASYWNGSTFIEVPNNGTAYIPLTASQNQLDIADNVVTTVGTLVVALAGFYFGTRAVAVARGAEDRTLSLVSPTEDPYEMGAKGTLDVILKPTPDGESITWAPPEGDESGRLVQIEPNKFQYTRGSPKDKVVLRFKLSRYPDVTADLTINKTT